MGHGCDSACTATLTRMRMGMTLEVQKHCKQVHSSCCQRGMLRCGHGHPPTTKICGLFQLGQRTYGSRPWVSQSRAPYYTPSLHCCVCCMCHLKGPFASPSGPTRACDKLAQISHWVRARPRSSRQCILFKSTTCACDQQTWFTVLRCICPISVPSQVCCICPISVPSHTYSHQTIPAQQPERLCSHV